MNERLQRNYAELILTRGVNLQPGQVLVIDTTAESIGFLRIVQKMAFELGAKDVIVHFSDPMMTRTRLLHADLETLGDIPRWQIEARTIYGETGACFLRLSSNDPDALAGVDPTKLAHWRAATSAPLKAHSARLREMLLAWSGVAIPNAAWARKVFPSLPEAEAVEALWAAILRCCYVTEQSGTDGWDRHIEEMLANVAKINALNLKTLRFQNSLGTDLTLDLCDGAVFAGGICHCPEPDGYLFAPNIPTEEILSTPHRLSANGRVYNALPFSYGGALIDRFWLEFKDGAVVDYDCEVGKDILKGILDTDEGSRRLGEVALVPYDSPIRQTGFLFYDTLFDENASCHLALGAGYTDTIPGGNRSEEALVARGLNTSMLHVDFMFGTADMLCTGVTREGKAAKILADGKFVLK